MSLACLKADDIPRFYEQIRRKIRGNKALCVVYDYFKSTWIDGFGVDIICQYDKVFRTNNNAEAFHSLLQRVFPPHPRFDDFVMKVCDFMDTTEVDYNAERLRPRSLKRCISVPYERISNLVNNFYNDRALALPLDAVLDEIGTILHSDVHYEDAYEEGPTTCFVDVDDALCDTGVPMEIDWN